MTLRIRQAQLENDLRQITSVIDERLRAAIDAATAHVTTAAGGPEAARTLLLAQRVKEDLAGHRTPPTNASSAARQVFLEKARRSLDGAMATLGEIRWEVRERAAREAIRTAGAISLAGSQRRSDNR